MTGPGPLTYIAYSGGKVGNSLDVVADDLDEDWARIDEIISSTCSDPDLELPDAPGVKICLNKKHHRYQGFYPGARKRGFAHDSVSWAWPGVSVGYQTASSQPEAYKEVVKWLREVHSSDLV